MEESSSFLKKRAKKLLQIGRCRRTPRRKRLRLQIDKSFLVLFFKKELLPYFPDLEATPKPRIQPRSATSQTDQP
jgi:hypothetical protein